jgi:hypothetical protein
MSISYSGLTNYGKAILPSADSALGSLYVVKDPPKSIFTRRIDKVGQTSSITEMIDSSSNRACEAISLFARGVNPMVSVSYGNEGNNGGRSGNVTNSSGSAQAYMPYRIMQGGAFRPPIMTKEQTMPLSRQPRQVTTAFTQKGFTDFSKTLMYSKDCERAVKQETLKACIRPTATYRIDTPLVEPFEVKYVIKNPVKFDDRAGISGYRTQDITTQQVEQPTKEILDTPLHANAYANYGSSNIVRYSDNSDFNTDKYIQDTLQGSMQTNPSQSIQVTPIEDIINIDIHTKDIMNISYTAPISGNTKDEYIHSDKELNRRVVNAEAITNKTMNIYHRPDIEHIEHEQTRNRPVTEATTNYGTSFTRRESAIDLNSRDYKLIQKVSAGGFSGRGQMPLLEKTNQVSTNIGASDKSRMGKDILDMQLGRYNY